MEFPTFAGSPEVLPPAAQPATRRVVTIEERELAAKEVVGKLSLTRDPRVYGAKLPPKEKRKRVLGIDLGTSCGIAWADVGKDPQQVYPMVLGQWDLSTGPFETGAIRLLRLRQFLEVVQPDLIALEDVKYTPPEGSFNGRVSVAAVVSRAASAAELIGALKWEVATWAETHGVPLQGVGIGLIKKFATGSGVADKARMIRACNEQFGTELNPEGYGTSGADNMADAAFLCAIGVATYFEAVIHV